MPGPIRRAAMWWFDPATTVEDRLFRWLAVLRFIVLANAVALNVYRADNFTRPVAGLLCVALMVVWTPVAAWVLAVARRRTAPMLLADLAIAAGLLLATPAVKGDGFSATVPGFWVMGALLAWAVHYRWVGGLVAGVVLSVADLAVRRDVTQANVGNVFLMLVGGPIVGFMAESLQRMAAQRDRAERAAAAAAERARLARAVHDGVLQVLGMVQRRGLELGGEAAELGRLAGEQEAALRTLVRQHDAADPVAEGRADLTAELARFGTWPGVEVATPGEPVDLRADVASELVALVAACLDNVRRHAGATARAWVLLEAWPDRVVVSVRDDGPGIPAGRLDEAAEQGRLGIVESIRGRAVDLGGSATLDTGPDGTEWEVVVPRRGQ